MYMYSSTDIVSGNLVITNHAYIQLFSEKNHYFLFISVCFLSRLDRIGYTDKAFSKNP